MEVRDEDYIGDGRSQCSQRYLRRMLHDSHEVCPFQRHADLFELLNWLAGQGIMNAGMAATGIIYPQFSLRLPSGRGAT